ncbi:hypothetical protein PG993_012605 [Apiospora rasikravindrae]|uniref:Rhodopsin domain-containing protein n=1 Tax=Apiospora rasikravindrae TaxID=990691 RepID=A0ABR1S2Y1_9PEZI
MPYLGGVDPNTLIPPPTDINDSNQDETIAIVVIFLGVLTFCVVACRVVSRWRSRILGIDDYAVVPALLCYLGWTAMSAWYNLHSGIGKPLGDVTYGEFIRFYQGVFVAAWMYPIMSAAIRVSILLFYRRIFAKGNPWYTKSINALLLLQGVYVIVFEITPGFSCRPFPDAWDPIKRLTSCTDFYIDQTIALYSVSLAFDIILLVFPIYAVSKLKISLKKRCGVGIIFALGTGGNNTTAPASRLHTSSQFSRMNQKIGNLQTPTVSLSHFAFFCLIHNFATMILTVYLPGFNYQASMYMPPQYNSYGKLFWIPTQVEPTVALIGTSLPAWLQIYSAASLQFSRIRSSIQSYRRASASGNSHESNRQSQSGLKHRPAAARKDADKHMGDSEIELRPMPFGNGNNSASVPSRGT